MKISKQSFFTTLSIVCIFSFALIGCGEGDLGNQGAPPPSADDEIKRIEANTKMPQQAKDAAIGQIKSRAAAAKAMAEAAKNGKQPGQ